MNRKLIGLCGKKRSGKDTIADYLTDNYDFVRYSFAGPLKEACKEMFLFDDEQVDGSKKNETDERWNITPRKMMQLIGTELFQYDIHEHLEGGEFDVGRQVWVKRFEFWFKENPNIDVVISDVRFPHEAEKIWELGGEIWKIDRGSTDEDEHPSEKEMDSIEGDQYIQNHGSFQELYDQVDTSMSYVTH